MTCVQETKEGATFNIVGLGCGGGADVDDGGGSMYKRWGPI